MIRILVALTLVASAGSGRAAPTDQGEKLYRSHCAACHRLRDPAERDRASWAQAVERYGPRAHLDPGERAQVLEFLSSRARDAAPAGGQR